MLAKQSAMVNAGYAAGSFLANTFGMRPEDDEQKNYKNELRDYGEQPFNSPIDTIRHVD